MECVKFVRARTRKWKCKYFACMYVRRLIRSNLVITVILIGALLWFLLSLYIWWMDDNHYVRVLPLHITDKELGNYYGTHSTEWLLGDDECK